jgi:preprotein translocase subunit SecA
LPIQHDVISRAIENAQRQVEGRNFEIRKHVLEYDDVMNKQREIIYAKRRKILEEENLKTAALEMVKDVIAGSVDLYINPSDYPENWDLNALSNYINPLFLVDIVASVVDREKTDWNKWRINDLKEKLFEKACEIYEERESKYSSDVMRRIEKIVMLSVIDNMWRGHLLEMDYLKEGIGLRAIGQRDPLVEFKNEAFNLFKELMGEIKFDTVRLLYNVRIVTKEEKQEGEKQKEEEKEESGRAAAKLNIAGVTGNVTNLTTSGPSGSVVSTLQARPVKVKKIGRNDPCPCGSGKKYKKCCGR